jgi:hypothetical protein
MILLAIGPAVILLPIGLALAGTFAWIRFGKKGSAAAVDPATGEPVPFIELRSGAAKARLFRNGATWNYTVQGPSPATGGNADAGAAAVAMAQDFATTIAGTPTAAVTGSAGSASNPSLEFSTEPYEDLWSWSVTTSDPVPSPIPGVPGKPISIGQGAEDTRSRALLQILATLSDELDWLTVQRQDGAAPPPMPGVNRLPGIVTSGDALAVTDLPAWIAYVSPFVREHLAEGHTADEIMDTEIAGGKDLPASTKLSGKSLAWVKANVERTVKAIADGDYLDVDSPDEQIAAQMVGADMRLALRHNDWWVGRHKDHVILVRPAKSAALQPGQFGANLGTRWEYLIWTGNARGYDSAVRDRRTMNAGVVKNNTIKAARARIDAGFPGFEGVVGETGQNAPFSGVVGGAAQQTCGYGEHYDAALGKCVKTPEIELKGDIVERRISASSWQERTHVDIVLFDFATGSNRARRDWTLGFGVCLRPVSDAPFGTLSNPGDGGAGPYGDPMQRFQIREAPPPGTFGSDGDRLDNESWADFIGDLAWKGQWQVKFERGAFVNVPQIGSVPTVKITKAMDEIDGAAAAELDPCPNVDERWPMPERDAGFNIHPFNGSWRLWKPVPTAKILVQGTRLVLRLEYTALPVFADVEGSTSPAMVGPLYKTDYDLQVRIVATGMNA